MDIAILCISSKPLDLEPEMDVRVDEVTSVLKFELITNDSICQVKNLGFFLLHTTRPLDGVEPDISSFLLLIIKVKSWTFIIIYT